MDFVPGYLSPRTKEMEAWCCNQALCLVKGCTLACREEDIPTAKCTLGGTVAVGSTVAGAGQACMVALHRNLLVMVRFQRAAPSLLAWWRAWHEGRMKHVLTDVGWVQTCTDPVRVAQVLVKPPAGSRNRAQPAAPRAPS